MSRTWTQLVQDSDLDPGVWDLDSTTALILLTNKSARYSFHTQKLCTYNRLQALILPMAGDRVFSVAAPKKWNTMPPDLR